MVCSQRHNRRPCPFRGRHPTTRSLSGWLGVGDRFAGVQRVSGGARSVRAVNETAGQGAHDERASCSTGVGHRVHLAVALLPAWRPEQQPGLPAISVDYKMHTYVADIEGEIARLPKLRGSNVARRKAALGRWIDEAQVRIARVLDNIVELRLPATCSHPTYVGPELTLEQALPDCTCAL